MFTQQEMRKRQQAYVKKVMRSQRPGPGAAIGLSRFMLEGTWLSADIFRHALLLMGVFGLVVIAAGATTDCTLYWKVLNWCSSFFVK